MAQAKLASQLLVETPDKVGMLAEVTSAVSGAGVNIEGICAYGMEGKAYFMVLTNDNNKAQGALGAKGWPLKSEEVVVVSLANNVGAAKEIADKIKQAGIDINYLYGTTCGSPDCVSALVISSKDNKAVLKAVS